jgi:hypothetical protein
MDDDNERWAEVFRENPSVRCLTLDHINPALSEDEFMTLFMGGDDRCQDEKDAFPLFGPDQHVSEKVPLICSELGELRRLIGEDHPLNGIIHTTLYRVRKNAAYWRRRTLELQEEIKTKNDGDERSHVSRDEIDAFVNGIIDRVSDHIRSMSDEELLDLHTRATNILMPHETEPDITTLQCFGCKMYFEPILLEKTGNSHYCSTCMVKAGTHDGMPEFIGEPVTEMDMSEVVRAMEGKNAVGGHPLALYVRALVRNQKHPAILLGKLSVGKWDELKQD